MNTEPDAAQVLLRRAMADYPGDPERSDFLIRYACTQAADLSPLYRVIYKFYNRRRRFDLAAEFAQLAVQAAASQGGLPVDPGHWTPAFLAAADPDVASHALLALKACAFIALRRGDPAAGERYLAILSRLDPEDGSGVSVVSALAASLG